MPENREIQDGLWEYFVANFDSIAGNHMGRIVLLHDNQVIDSFITFEEGRAYARPLYEEETFLLLQCEPYEPTP